MAHYNFNKDIYEGEEGEIVVIKQLKELGAKPIHQNKDNKYDVIMEIKNKKIKYEIKTDVYCKPYKDTGNIFVETQCRGKKSGINVTQAKWFVTYFKFLNEIWYIKTQDLVNLINQNNNKLIFHENAGDINSKTKGWLIPRHQFLDQFIVRDSNTHQIKKNVIKGHNGEINYDKLNQFLNEKNKINN